MIFWRYAKLYGLFVKNSLAIEVQYKTNFFLSNFAAFLWALVYVFLYVFIFQHIKNVQFWDYEKSLILASTFLVTNSTAKLFFEKNLSRIANLVYEGDLDLILAKPINSQFFVSLRQVSLRTFLRFLFACLVFTLVLHKVNFSLNLNKFLIFLLLLAVSLIIIYSLWFMTTLSVFWIGNIENIYELFHPILRTTALPYDLFPNILRETFFFVIPLIFINTIPVKALFGLISWPTIIYGIFIASFLLFLSHKLWNFALTRYSSASS